MAIQKSMTLIVNAYNFHGSRFNTQDCRDHLLHASRIWSQAGIIFGGFNIRAVSRSETVRLLGNDRKLHVHFGRLDQYDEPGYTERRTLRGLRRGGILVHFANLDGPLRADPELNQVYMGRPVPGQIGRTLAHEIGHILLGSGHQDRWKSGIMRGASSSRVDFHVDEARKARSSARRRNLVKR